MRILSVFAICVLGCGGASKTSGNRVCVGKVSGDVTATFNPCDADGELVVNGAFATSPHDYSGGGVTNISLQFNLIDHTPVAGKAYSNADMSLASLSVDRQPSGYVLQSTTPSQPSDQGTVTLLFSSVTLDPATKAYHVLGTLDVTAPSAGNAATKGSVTVHIEF